MIGRRHLLGAAAALPGAALLGSLPGTGQAQSDDYRALVVVYLNGGNDGNNTLVPTDGLYGDYQAARQNLALPRNSLVALPGSAAGHTFGVHPALASMATLYGQQRLAFIANVGALVQPCTAAQVLANAAELPPFLLSHSDQTAIVQGWTVSEDNSGWAGRAIEALPARLRNRCIAVTTNTDRVLVQGQRSPVSFMDPWGGNWWGIGDLLRPSDTGTQSLARMAQWQFANQYEAEYARSYGRAFEDSSYFAEVAQRAVAPTADFGSEDDQQIVRALRRIAAALPVFRADGLKRQVFQVHWGAFDTHANQRGSDPITQDAQLAVLDKVLKAFDDTNRANGLDMNVVTLVMTEFGRTVRPGSGGGSEHAWGNHWWALGGPVAGGTVVGDFPSPVLGGADDGDRGRNGRHVPKLSSDQVGATLMQWMGLAPAQFVDVMPNLAKFSSKTIPLLRA